MSAKSVIQFAYFEILYNNICDFGVLNNFENPAESHLQDGLWTKVS